jgi:N-acyl homoserine lactone hydrolase
MVRVHVIETGWLTNNKTFWRGGSWWSLLRRSEPYRFPAQAFVVEHPEGLIAIDTGLGAHVRGQRALRRFVPVPDPMTPGEEIGPRMRALGLDPADVRRVVLTHLDWDHAGGLRHFPRAEVLVHRPELEFAGTPAGRMRYRPALAWPSWFSPRAYDMEPVPYGPFDASRAITAAGDVRVVPLPGHSPGQVGIVVEAGGSTLLFAADHMLREDWFREDLAADRLVSLGVFFRDQAIDTSRRVARVLEGGRTVLVPSHDAGAAARLAALETVAVSASRARRPAPAPR